MTEHEDKEKPAHDAKEEAAKQHREKIANEGKALMGKGFSKEQVADQLHIKHSTTKEEIISLLGDDEHK